MLLLQTSHCSAKRTMLPTVPSPKLLEYCQKGMIVLPSPQEPPSFLRHLLTAFASIGRTFQINVRAYNNSFTMGFVKAE